MQRARVIVYAFGEFVLEPSERQLRRSGRVVPLTPKAFDTLEALVSRAGRAVRKDELLSIVWPDTHIVEATLAQNICALRKALGDAALIETVPKFGYRFTASVRQPNDARACCLRWGSRQLPLVAGENVVGRDPEVHVTLDGGTVSRRHARITITAAHTLIEDLGSKNGTFVRGERVTAPKPLADGDLIGFGSLTLTFHTRPPLLTTDTQSAIAPLDHPPDHAKRR
jgi:DNA-binding winged helix-turn-helix (wHTH) protein